MPLEMKKLVKRIIGIGAVSAILCIVIMLICNQIVVNNAKGKVFSEIDSIKYNKVGLLLGTTPLARIGRITNFFFVYRIDAAEQLYKAGKIEKILISGDEHLGLDVENIQAYNAKAPKSRRAYLTTIREYFARVKLFMDLIADKTDRE